MIAETKVYHACVTGTLVKDTIKIADEEGFCVSTPDRKRVWAVQTPQSFSYPLVLDAYEKLLEQENKLLQAGGIHYGRCHGRRADDFPKSKAGRR